MNKPITTNSRHLPIEQRMRGRKGTARRLRLWALDPNCAKCQIFCEYPYGFEMDHIVAITNGGPDEEHNLQVLCLSCHRDKTAKDLGHRVKVQTGPDGWPVESGGTT